jgi:uncharacterized protein with PQ loop repeat
LVAGDPSKVDILQAQIVGVTCGAFYVYQFYKNCQDPDKRQALISMVRAGACLLLFEVFCSLSMSLHTSTRILGGISAAFSVMVTASPLVSIEDVLRTQSVASMQIDMVIVCFCGSCCWTALGFIMHDASITFSNCFALAIGSVQLHLILKFSEITMWNGKAASGSAAFLKDQEQTSLFADKSQQWLGYEASVYKRGKIFMLLTMANLQFMFLNYVNFAMVTLAETAEWLAEVRARPCSLGRPCGRGASWFLGGCKKPVEMDDEGLGLL